MGSPFALTSSAMSRETAPRLMTISLSAMAWTLRPRQTPVTSMSARDSKLNSPCQSSFNASASLSEATAVRKPRPPMLTPSRGVLEPAICRAVRSIVPSPPKTSSKSDSHASSAALARISHFNFASRAVAASQMILRPARWRRRAAARTLAAQADLSALPMRPMRWKWSAFFFNQHQKFFVAGGAEQGRFKHIAPAKASLRGDKFFQLGDHAFMHDGVGDDAAAFVGLGLARFKLRFDERDDSASGFQQRHGGRQDFFQRDERAVNDGEVGGRGELFRFEITRIGFFHDHHAVVTAEFPRELAPADVHGKNFCRAVLQQTISEAAGGGAEVERGEAGDGELKMNEGVFELVAAAADVFFRRDQNNFVRGPDGVAGLACGTAVDADLASKDGAFGAFAAVAEGAFDERLIKSGHGKQVAGKPVIRQDQSFRTAPFSISLVG